VGARSCNFAERFVAETDSQVKKVADHQQHASEYSCQPGPPDKV
jgi:hypothetical protein